MIISPDVTPSTDLPLSIQPTTCIHEATAEFVESL